MNQNLVLKGLVSAICLCTLFTGCGGGSDGGSSADPSTAPNITPPIEGSTEGLIPPTTNPELPSIPPTTKPSTEVNIPQSSVDLVDISAVQNKDYPSASLLAIEVLNASRQTCGIARLSQDSELVEMSRKHALYLQYLNSNATIRGISPHLEASINGEEGISSSSNPFFTGFGLNDRVRTAKYNKPGFYVSENISERYSNNANGKVDSPDSTATALMKGLLSAPYHLQSLVDPKIQYIGSSFVAYTPFRQNVNQAKSYTFVSTASGNNTSYSTPSDGMITYPCEGITSTVTALWNESPNPVAGTNRNLAQDPIGQPIYVFMPNAAKIEISNVKFYDTANNIDIPVEILDHKNDPYKGNSYELPKNKAFILPITDNLKSCQFRGKTNCGLQPNTKYTVSFDVMVNSKTLQKKSFSFTTGITNLA